MEQGQGTTLQTAPSLLYREGPKRLTDGYVHAPGSSEAGHSVSEHWPSVHLRAQGQMLHGSV